MVFVDPSACRNAVSVLSFELRFNRRCKRIVLPGLTRELRGDLDFLGRAITGSQVTGLRTERSPLR